jgi:superfamily II DNA or RNA helicase
MWHGDDDTLMVFPPTEEVLTSFVSLTSTTSRPYDLPKNMSLKQHIKIPAYFLNDEGKLRDYQETAISKWWQQNGRGIFHMATGSGKTATALAAITKLYDRIVIGANKPLVIIVSVPFVSLAKQWLVETAAFNFKPVPCFGSRDDWLEGFQTQLQNLKSERSGCLFAVAVNKSLTGSTMRSLMSSIKCDFLFVGDEMHNLGADNNLSSLPQNANFRLGAPSLPLQTVSTTRREPRA